MPQSRLSAPLTKNDCGLTRMPEAKSLPLFASSWSAMGNTLLPAQCVIKAFENQSDGSGARVLNADCFLAEMLRTSKPGHQGTGRSCPLSRSFCGLLKALRNTQMLCRSCSQFGNRRLQRIDDRLVS